MNNPNKFLIVLSIALITLISIMGGWWLLNFYQLVLEIEKIAPHFFDTSKKINMIFWEGISFLAMTLWVCIGIIIFYLYHLKKTKTMQHFFSGLTHEIKTPIASIKLQAEVIEGYALNITDHLLKKKIKTLTVRLI